MKRSRGFSMVELLVVATIIALLAAAGVVSFTTASRNSRDAKRRADLAQVQAALELYRTEEGAYPSSSSYDQLLTDMNSDGYLTNISGLNDPKAPPNYLYRRSGFSGSCTVYELCATLESTGAQYCVCNP